MLQTRQSFTCPCCGGFLGESAPIEFLLEKVSKGQQAVILGMLAKRVGRLVSKEAFMEQMYGDRADGGPDSAGNVVNVQLIHLRKKIKPFGWALIRQGGGHGAPTFYRLAPMEAGAW